MSAITSYLLAAVAVADGDPDVVCANEALERGMPLSRPLRQEWLAAKHRWVSNAAELLGPDWGTDCCYHHDPDARRHLIADLRDAAQVEALVSGACQ